MRWVLAVCWMLAAASAATPVFQAQTGVIPFRHRNSPTRFKYLPETMGGGVAVFDYNNDGLLDLFFVNSGSLPGPGFQRNRPENWNRLYRQNRDGSFTDVTEAAGLARQPDGNYGMGVATGDYDNDGRTDLYLTSFGHTTLYHNNGDGTFTDVTRQSGTDVGGWSASAGWFDYDNDGRLDLFVTRYMDWSFAASHVCVRETYCPPGDFPATTNVLLHNRGDGTFEDVSVKSGIAAVRGRSLGVAFNDYDADGHADIFVANDGMAQFLFHNNGDGTFKECALEAGVSLSDDGKPYAGMGVAFEDQDNDGRPDLLITNLSRQLYAVYRNDGGTFTYRSRESGLAMLSARSSGWGLNLVDFDNDGWKDLFVAQSHVMDNVEAIDPGLHYRERPLVALNHNGRFESADSGLSEPVAGRGAAFGDLQNSGREDIVMSVLGGSPIVFRNQLPVAHWLTIDLQGTRSNRDGFGATIHIGNQTAYATSSGSYLSASDKRVHFGLGSATKTDISILWPSGQRQTLPQTAADQIVHVKEPQ